MVISSVGVKAFDWVKELGCVKVLDWVKELDWVKALVGGVVFVSR